MIAAAHQPTKMVVQFLCGIHVLVCGDFALCWTYPFWKSIRAVVFVTTTVTIEMIHERQQLAAQSSILQLTANPDRPLYTDTQAI
jgi:hypothetical protein